MKSLFLILIYSFCYIIFLVNSQEENGFITSESLQNYYPFNSDIIDVLNEKDLYGGKNWVLINDRNRNNNSAISFNNGFLEMPVGTYISGDFTIMFWIRPKISKINDFKSIIELSNLGESDIINFVYIQSSSKKGENVGRFDLHYGTSHYFSCQSDITFFANKWTHLTFTLKEEIGTMYFNGDSVKSCPLSSQNKIKRNITTRFNYLGKSSWSANSNFAEHDLDDLKIFNRALSRKEIRFEKDNSLLD